MQRIRYSLEVLEPAGLAVSRTQFDSGRYRIGRDPSCELHAELRGLSREHAALEVLDSGGCVVRDLGSTNGTRLDGRRVSAAAVAGDFVLELGTLRLRFREHGEEPAGLAFATGLVPSPARSANAGADAQPGTQVLGLVQRLRDAAVAALPLPAPALADSASRVLAAWLDVLQTDALRLERGAATLAAAGDQARTLQCLAESEGVRLLGEAELGSRHPALAAVLTPLLAWLPPAPEPVQANDEAAAPLPGVATANRALRRVLEALRRVARSRVGVLLLGETGVGKEVLARWVHDCSPRADGPFVAINCAALPRDLLEAELFGIEKGAATGVEARPGVFERAHGGTLFLDELGDMPPDTQVRLLRALEDGRIHRIGGKQMITVDVRLVGATNRDLEQEIAAQRFRLDLYHRLAGFEARVPPLRERPEDIAPLAIHFYTRTLAESGVASPGISAAALACLQAWHWPGNVRELRQALESACAMLQDGEVLDRGHLPPRVAALCPQAGARAAAAPHQAADAAPGSLADAVAAAERHAIERALDACDGDAERAWSLLGIGKTTWYKKLRELGLTRTAAESGEQ